MCANIEVPWGLWLLVGAYYNNTAVVDDDIILYYIT